MTHEEYRNLSTKSKESAQRALFEEYFNYVYTIVFSRLRTCASREDIEECVGEVFAEIYIYYDNSKDLSGDVSGFVGTIARRKSSDIFSKLTRSKQKIISLDDEETVNIKAPDDIEKYIENKETHSALMNCIELLGEPDSTIIIQKFFYMRSAKEISALVSLTPEAVRTRLSRALKKLRKELTSMNITL